MARAAEDLSAAGVPDATREAQKLWGLAFPRRYADHDDLKDGKVLARFQGFVARRVRREPFAHIAGHRFFWKHKFRVTPDVLDPRPDTETLVELALAEPFARVLDLGTGSGCIVISLLADRPEARGVGTDVSDQAVLVAGENAVMAGVADRLILPLSDWYDDIGGRFDLIVSNPPYIAADEMAGLAPEVRDYEPHGALTDYGDGLTAYRAIAARALDHLAPGGRLLVEIGPTQAEAVQEIFAAQGLEGLVVHADLDGRCRVVEARAQPLAPAANSHK